MTLRELIKAGVDIDAEIRIKDKADNMWSETDDYQVGPGPRIYLIIDTTEK